MTYDNLLGHIFLTALVVTGVIGLTALVIQLIKVIVEGLREL